MEINCFINEFEYYKIKKIGIYGKNERNSIDYKNLKNSQDKIFEWCIKKFI